METVTKNYAIINTDGIIGNIFVAEPDNPIIGILNGLEVPEDGGYMIGDAYIDGAFVRIASDPERKPPEIPITPEQAAIMELAKMVSELYSKENAE